MLAPLYNETIFKKAFTDKIVFQQFIKDLFDVEITVDKIETEKKFEPPIANIDFSLDIFAETTDHRFVIEIQKIDYDYNFNRFLNYFTSLYVEQVKRGKKYAVPQTILGVVILTSPFKINQLTGEPIRESVLSIDFNPRNPKNEIIEIWEHKLVFLNPNPEYKNDYNTKNYQDWLDLFHASMDENINIKLNVNNIGIAKTIEIIDYQKLDPQIIAEMRKSDAKKAMISIIENENLQKGINIGIEKGIDIGMEKGMKKGMEKGREEERQKHQQEKIDMIREMIAEGMSDNQILRLTKIDISEIQEIRKEL